MGSLLLFVLGVAAPLACALALLWRDEHRRLSMKMRQERTAQDGRGLQPALGGKPAAATSLSTGSERDRRLEVDRLIHELARKGTLLETLRAAANGTPARAPAAARTPDRDGVMQQAVSEWGQAGLAAALEQLKARLAAIAEMEMIWADPHADVERDPLAMLERSLWVFEPEYVVGEGNFALDQRFGAVAKPTLGAGLYPGMQSKEGEHTLVVDLKSARTTVGADDQLEAWANVRELIRGGAVRERDPVDVYIVGGAVDELDGNPRIEGRYRNVRITSYDYGQLIARAKRLTFGLYDELKETAPFLRRHRDEILAAQRAAADRAATEASAPHDEQAPAAPSERRHDRHEQLADIMRRGEAEPPRQNDYEGDHVVIGKRRHG